MGTEVLYPQDCFAQHRIIRPSSHAGFVPRRRTTTHQRPASFSGGSPQFQHPATLAPARHIAGPCPRPFPKAPAVAEGRRKKDTSPRQSHRAGIAPTKAGAGTVTILKRGESLDAKTSRSITRETRSKPIPPIAGNPSVLSSDGCGDLIVYGAQRIGPEPAMVIVKPVRVRSASADGYAGSAFSMSPSPRALPLPSFWKKSETGSDAATEEQVDLPATQDLRRLLRLE